MTGCGSAWLERLVWDQEVAGSNPVTPILTNMRVAQLVERDLAKVEAAGSSPVSRSFLFLGFMRVPRFSESAFSLHNRNYLKFLLEVFTLSARV